MMQGPLKKGGGMDCVILFSKFHIFIQLLRGQTFFELNRTWFLSYLNMGILENWVLNAQESIFKEKQEDIG